MLRLSLVDRSRDKRCGWALVSTQDTVKRIKACGGTVRRQLALPAQQPTVVQVCSGTKRKPKPKTCGRPVAIG